jgi:hypothetical protein
VTAFEIFIKKRDVPYDAKSVGDNTEFMSVAEMPVDILLIDKRVSFGNVGQL